MASALPEAAAGAGVAPGELDTAGVRRGLKKARDQALVSILAYAGLRPGEALALRWGDIGERTILVERAVSYGEMKSTKTRASRSVRMVRPLKSEVAKLRLRGQPTKNWSSRLTTADHGAKTTGGTGAGASSRPRPSAQGAVGSGRTTCVIRSYPS
jgi:integrase